MQRVVWFQNPCLLHICKIEDMPFFFFFLHESHFSLVTQSQSSPLKAPLSKMLFPRPLEWSELATSALGQVLSHGESGVESVISNAL